MQHTATSGAGATLPHAWRPYTARPVPSPILEVAPKEMPERDLPIVNQRACGRIFFWRSGPFDALNARDRAVLADIVRCVGRKYPTLPVYVRRETLAIRENCSVPTIGRALARLEAQGWLSRDQVKSRARGFQVGSVRLSEEAVAWLGFHQPALFELERGSQVIDACGEPLQCIHRQPGGAVEQEKAKTVRQGEVPPNLAWLERIKVSRYGVFALMKMARKKGVLLETVVELCKEQISKSRQPFAYIRDLLCRDKDWNFVAEHRGQDKDVEVAMAQQIAVNRALAKRLQEVTGQWWLSASIGQLLRVEEGIFAVYTQGLDGRAGQRLGTRPDAAKIFEAIDAGRLVVW